MILALEDDEVFVFGSNYAGQHAGGAAKQAREQFGAEEGIGEGLTGQCYAFPTLESDMQKCSVKGLEQSRDRFFSTARALPEKRFLMTAVGTGIAGFSHEEMKALFVGTPSNVQLPEEWLTEQEA